MSQIVFTNKHLNMIPQTTITINKQELVIKRAFAALILFEEMTGIDAYKADTSLKHSLIMFYAIVKVNNPKFKLTFDEFLAYLDEHPDIYPEYVRFTASLLNATETAVADKKKAETR